MGTGRKKFSIESLGVIVTDVSSHFQPFSPESMHPSYGRNRTIYWMLIQSMYRLLENLVSDFQGIATKLARKLSLQRALPLFWQTAASRWWENVTKPVNSMSLGPWLYLICCEVSSLIRNNAVWNTMMVDKASQKSMIIDLAEVLCAKKANL